MAEKAVDRLTHIKDCWKFVCAIDFGTSYSGYAYGSVTDLDDITLNSEWGSRFGISAYKTSTTVLTGQNGMLEEFGFDAEFKYMRLLEQDDAKDLNMYRYFKMLLHHEQEITSDTVVKSDDGTTRSALDIFGYAIEYLREHFLQAVDRARGIQLDVRDVLWVLTVPAIWNERSKKFMRKAAKKGGLVTDEHSNQLILALEPEAASIYCQSLQVDKFTGHEVIQGRCTPMFHVDTKHLIVDAGGGTVDITAHQILPNGELKELIAATGGDWGGMQINRCFERLLEKYFGKEFMSQFKRDCLAIWIDLQSNFERKKRGTQPDGETPISIEVNVTFAEYIQNKLGKSVKEILPIKDNADDLYYHQGKLIITGTGVLNLYHTNLGYINKHLAKVLSSPELKDLKYIFLVGGYAHSEYLYNSIQTEFPNHAVLVPEQASTAIMKGAVLFGHNPNRIVTRIARKTYGYCVRKPFQEGVHDPEKAIFDEEEVKYCDLIFRKFVTKDEEVTIGKRYVFRTQPFQADATHVTKRLYYTDKKDPMYVDEVGVERLGEIRVDMDDTELGKDREIKMTVVFSGTEMQLKCSVKGQSSVKKTLDFLSSHTQQL